MKKVDVNGEIVEITDEEYAEMYPEMEAENIISPEEQLSALKAEMFSLREENEVMATALEEIIVLVMGD